MGSALEERGARPKRIGLVLGAGGPVGHAFHAGVLAALEHALGWDVREADRVLGTSAGAQVGALLRAGMSGRDLSARVRREALGPDAAVIAAAYVRPSSATSLPRSLTPAAPGFALHALTNPSRLRPGRLAAALLPPGRVRLDPLAEGLRTLYGARWPERGLWVPAVVLDTGETVIFGREDAPAIDVGTAVAASAAVPSVFSPVEHEGVRYVDGAVASATHLDALVGEKLDLVIVSSPLSIFAPMRFLVRREVAQLERTTPVALVEPTPEAAAAMGPSPMDEGRGPRVAQVAFDTTLRALDVGALRERMRDTF